jgi:hypothetical protein
MAYQEPLTRQATSRLSQRLKQQKLDWQKMHGLAPPPPPDVEVSPTMEKAMGVGEGPTASFFNAMQGARGQGLMREKLAGGPGPMPFAPAPGVARTAPGMAPPPTTPVMGTPNPWMVPQTPAGGLTPDSRAMIDMMTGKRVHKDMSGRQIGLQGVSPTLKYLMYSMQNRRHRGMGGQDVY